MHAIPIAVRHMLEIDPFMKRCIWDNEDCQGRVEWEHALIYAGKQVQVWWAIVPCCTFHHRGKGLDKGFNQAVAFARAIYFGVTQDFSYDEVLWGIKELFPKYTWPISFLLKKYAKQLKKLKL